MVIPVSALPQDALSAFRAGLDGTALLADDREYDAARRLWNGAIDRHPGIIVRCASVRDVQRCLELVTSNDLELAVRAGGHGVAGDALCDEGVVIDVSPLKAVHVDAPAQIVSAGAGLTWGEFDSATSAQGLATTGGQISTTGIAGLTLGGGLGWLMRRHGLTVDNLLAVDLVTPDGRHQTVDETTDSELFWALRGGGGNFGVATRFAYRLHPVTDVLAGTLVYPAERAPEVLRVLREVSEDAPDELTVMTYFLPALRSDLLPADAQGRPAVSIAICCTGPRGRAEALAAPLRALSGPIADTVRWMPYLELQALFDFSAPFGLGAYWKSHYLAGLPDAAIETVVEHATSATSPLSQVLLTSLGGVAARVGEEETATGHRDAAFVVEILAKWEGSVADDHARWADEFWRALEPWATGGVYVNFLGDEPDRVRDAYPPRIHDRLAAIKARVDPDNLFHHNRNIAPNPSR